MDLYEAEVKGYQRQINELKTQATKKDELNLRLEHRIEQLQTLVEKAHVANQDLNTAFEHLRQENLKLQVHPGTNEQDNRIVQDQDNAIERIQRQYINFVGESVNWVSDKDRLNRRVKFLERECERYHRDNTTLGKQVRRLLITLEEERGMIIKSSRQPECPDPKTASDVIDNNLVTFESIEELQAQNQKLLSLVKELSKNEEERDIQVENEAIRRLQTEQTELKSQLQTISDDRDRALAALNTIFKERDLFRILLCKSRQVEHLTPEVFQRMVSIACSAGPLLPSASATESTQDKDEHIASLQKMITKLELDVTNLRDTIEVNRERAETELKLKTELLEKAHLEIVAERNQIDALRLQNQTYEKNIATLTAEFDETRAKAQKLCCELEFLADKNKDIASELERERSSAKSEIMSHLSKIQSQCNQRDELHEHVTKLQSKLTESNMEVARLRSAVSTFQYLRNIERTERIELSRQYSKLLLIKSKRRARPKSVQEKHCRKHEEPRHKYKKPHPKWVEPHLEPEQLHLELEEPHLEPDQPHLEPEQPHLEPEQPHLEPEQPHLEPEQLHLEPEQPHLEPEQLHLELEEPHPKLEEPKPEQEEPKPEREEPKPEQEEPKSELEEPKPEQEEPKPEQEEPKPEREEPKPEQVPNLPNPVELEQIDRPIILKRRNLD